MQSRTKVLSLIFGALLIGVCLLANLDYLRVLVCDTECQAQYLIRNPIYAQITDKFVLAKRQGVDVKLALSEIRISLDERKANKIGIVAITDSGEVILSSSFGSVIVIATPIGESKGIEWQCKFYERYSEEPPHARRCSLIR